MSGRACRLGFCGAMQLPKFIGFISGESHGGMWIVVDNKRRGLVWMGGVSSESFRREREKGRIVDGS
jgi:hypothetical protein